MKFKKTIFILCAVCTISVAATAFLFTSDTKTPLGEPGTSFLKWLDKEQLEERSYYAQPNSYFLEKLDEPQLVRDGQTLHPKLQYEFQERIKARKAKGEGFNYNEWLKGLFDTPKGREWLLRTGEQNWIKTAEDVGPMAKVEDITISANNRDIRIRIYWPEASEVSLPGLVYFHGGGFLMASSEAVEPQAKILAKEGKMVVASVNYNLAPDHKFPAAHEDALAAYDWFVENAASLGVNSAQIGVAGDSAGGNLSAVISEEKIRTGGTIPKAQLLYYPFTDAKHDKYPSFDLFGDGYGLDKNFIKMATLMFLADPVDVEHPWLNLNDTANFAKHPTTIVATAGFDPIRDQGRVFAEKLEAANVDVFYKNYASLNHGFLEASYTIDDAKDACFKTARMMGELLRK